ncbi:MAG: toll/interleukin-1 receptor domain-containing protein, partial [bacterium]|nr:toll/interleukin-1 receptor domain-containing protein [bacterium]
MPHDVFISYSSDDKLTANATCSILEEKKIRCWIAPRDLLPGQEYGEMIVDAIRNAKIVVLIFSSSAQKSKHVKREIERAVSKGKSILTVRIEDTMPVGSMEYALSNEHWLDALTPL